MSQKSGLPDPCFPTSAGPGTIEMRPASCPSQSAPESAHSPRAQLPASPCVAARSARQRPHETTPPSPDESKQRDRLLSPNWGAGPEWSGAEASLLENSAPERRRGSETVDPLLSVPDVPVDSPYASAFRNSLTTSMSPTMCRLNSSSSSAGIQYSRWTRAPAIWTGNCARYSVSTSKRRT